MRAQHHTYTHKWCMHKRPRSPSSSAHADVAPANTHALNNLLRHFPYMEMHREALKVRTPLQLAALADTMQRVEQLNATSAHEPEAP